METRGDYQADASASETTADATPEKVVPLRRGFFMPENDYVDRLAGVIDGRTGWVLTYLLRQTVGFHRREYKCSQHYLAKALGYSRNTLVAALRELESLHVVTSDASERTRTQVRTFRLEPIESWTLPQTSSNFELVETGSEIELVQTGSNFELVDERTSSENELVTPQTSSKFEPHINTEIKDSPEKENDSDANASAERDTAPATSEKPTRQKRKLSPEARERHNAEAAYVSDLCKRQLAALKCGKSPKPGEDRAGGHWYYTAGPDGAPADPEQVIALLRVVKQSPHYSGQYLTLQATIRYWPEWLLDPKNVRDSIAVERRKADYARAAANGHKAQRPAGREQTYAKTGEDMAPKGWS